MAEVKTITLGGKDFKYDVKYINAYVSKIISNQSELYSSIKANDLPYNAVKEIYVDGTLRAELIGSQLHTVTPERKPKHDPYVDRHEPPTAGMGRYKGHTVPEEFDESHALDMVLNDMVENMTDEEIREMYLDETTEEDGEELKSGVIDTADYQKLKETTNKSIYLQSVTSPPPYWVTDTTAGNLEINYSTKNI